MRSTGRVVLAALISLGLLLATAPARADTPDPVGWPKPRFISYNVCGAKCDMYSGGKTAWRDNIVGAMDRWDADVVMFQEMCHGQWTFLRDLLQSRSGGPKYDSVWGAGLPSVRGCGKWGGESKRFGLAIFVKGGAGTIEDATRAVHPLPKHAQQAGSEDRILLCARGKVTGRQVRTCTTHIDPYGENPSVQIPEVARITKGYADQGDPVVLGGDFNRLPKDTEMRALYNHSGGTGVFQEVDENDTSYFGAAGCAPTSDRCRSGEATALPPCSPGANPPGKIDYIFLSHYWFRNVKGDAAACTPGMSDHHLLRGAAAWAN
jgi:endonuclease/exonuclease/phosphatase family metal-dependent hydrolase